MQNYSQLIFVLIFHATARYINVRLSCQYMYTNLLHVSYSLFRYAFSQDCPKRTDFRHGVVIYNDRSEAYYWCFGDYRIVGPNFRTCDEGAWSEEEPYCAYSGKLLSKL